MTTRNERRLRPPLYIPFLLALVPLSACHDSNDDNNGGGSPVGQTGFSAVLDQAQETPTPVHGTRVRVTVTNRAPDMGTFQTPVWVGFHDGTFDLFDTGTAANANFPTTHALERLAEDGNVTPLQQEFTSAALGTTQGAMMGQLGPMPGPIAPGETVSMVFELDPANPANRYFSYASMVIPSNDAFISNDDPLAHEIFDGAGTFDAVNFTVTGGQVLDAGTEINDEGPTTTAFHGQTVPDTGTDEMGVVAAHPGFLAVGMGGILDDPMFANADFTTGGYETLSFTFEELPAAAQPTGVATVQLVNDDSTVAFHVMATGLSGPVTAAHFHMAPAGTAGPILITLTGSITENENGNVVIDGSLPTTPEFVTALRAGDVYVNMHTALNPTGELRGQVTTDAAFFGPLSSAQETPAPTLGTDVHVTVRNRAPANGTYQTPVWIGFHDGTFETFDLGAAASTHFPASNALEHLAEDGNTTPITDDFAAGPAGKVQGVLEGQILSGPIEPGETVTRTFRLDPMSPMSRYLTYATMIIPSNDAFLSNDDPMAHEIFDAGGTFTGASFTVPGSAALDAGTEVNDEIPANTAFFGQTTPDTGVDEMGNVAAHAGFLATGMGGILDDPMFANADFTAGGYQFLDVSLSQSTPSEMPSGVVTATLNGAETQLTFHVSARDLSGPVTAMHFHQGAAGVAGPILITLTPFIDVNEDGYMTGSGTVSIDADFLTALRAGEVYFNAHTALNPAGELRGQVAAVP